MQRDIMVVYWIVEKAAEREVEPSAKGSGVEGMFNYHLLAYCSRRGVVRNIYLNRRFALL